MYKDCLRSAAYALARVTNMPAYDDCVADAVSALRVFVEKCQSPFDAQEITSQLEQVNRESGTWRISWALLEVFFINFYSKSAAKGYGPTCYRVQGRRYI